MILCTNTSQKAAYQFIVRRSLSGFCETASEQYVLCVSFERAFSLWTTLIIF